MQTIDQIRHARFLELLAEAGSNKAMADRLGVTSAQISQLKTRSLHSTSGRPRTIGDEQARKMEQAFNKPTGWMDTLPLPADGPPLGSGVSGAGLAWATTAVRVPSGYRIPVVGHARLGDNGHFVELEYPVGHGDGYLDMPSSDPNAYAIRCVGDSMAPRIEDGEYVIVEPNREVKNGDEVLVRATDGRVMVKKFLYERDRRLHLVSVNSAHPPIVIDAEHVTVMHRVVGRVDFMRWVAE